MILKIWVHTDTEHKRDQREWKKKKRERERERESERIGEYERNQTQIVYFSSTKIYKLCRSIAISHADNECVKWFKQHISDLVKRQNVSYFSRRQQTKWMKNSDSIRCTWITRTYGRRSKQLYFIKKPTHISVHFECYSFALDVECGWPLKNELYDFTQFRTMWRSRKYRKKILPPR